MPNESLSRQSHNVQRPIAVSECKSCHLLQWRRNTQLNNGWDENTWFLVVESFKIVGSAVPVFGKKITFFHFIYLEQNIGASHLFKKESPVFVWNWAQNNFFT